MNEAGVYFADDYRATKNLTLNYGLRWDYFSPPDEAFNRWSNFSPVTGQYLVAGVNGVSNTVGVLRYWPNFGPRLGFAYQALFQTVILSGGGLFYNASGSLARTMRFTRYLPFG